MTIGIIGCGFVGNAIKVCMEKRGNTTCVYDKFKDGMKDPKVLSSTSFCFIAVPTPYSNRAGNFRGYDISAIIDSLNVLQNMSYMGVVVIKSTISAGTTSYLANMFKGLTVLHNPEFLTAKTAVEDFDNQKNIIIGYPDLDECRISSKLLSTFYKEQFPEATVSVVKSEESECIKSFCNSFYASKVQLFTEFFCLCNNVGADFEVVRKLMLGNGWINPMHTLVPGTDGQISFGGGCFPKDISALVSCTNETSTISDVLNSVINERNAIRGEK